jgi:hypothetical protein
MTNEEIISLARRTIQNGRDLVDVMNTINEMTPIEETLIGRIGTQLTRAVEEANQAYEIAPDTFNRVLQEAMRRHPELW